MYEKECQRHEDTNKRLISANTHLESKIQEVHNLRKEHEVSIKELNEKVKTKNSVFCERPMLSFNS